MPRRPSPIDACPALAAARRAPAACAGRPSHAASLSGVTAVLSAAVRAARSGHLA
ncbi:UNVERIFIED_ORG: hypothetical protein LHJ69_13105 [Shinella sp. XGS7]|nr:hypothetical protein [Shinella sp. XGS7]